MVVFLYWSCVHESRKGKKKNAKLYVGDEDKKKNNRCPTKTAIFFFLVLRQHLQSCAPLQLFDDNNSNKKKRNK